MMKRKTIFSVVLAAFLPPSFGEQLAPRIEPLREELVGVLFQRIDKKENIQFELLCRALVGPQFTLRAYAATLLGDSGDKRAIPFLIDALSDESVHDGALYLDAGDATTRHRANRALKKLTEQDFGFVWSDPKEKRNEAISKWIAWYRKTSEPGGPANGSQPTRSETNRASPAAGSRR
jgi:hypothetical protein